MFMLGLVALFVFLGLKTDAAKAGRDKTIWFFISLLTLIYLYLIVVFFGYPGIISESVFFKPGVYASLTFASLGHVWVFVVLLFMITLLFHWFFKRGRALPSNLRLTVPVLLLVLGSVAFAFAHQLGKSLIMDSTISFEAYKLNSISPYTFIGLLILLMANMVCILLLDKALLLLNGPLNWSSYIWIALVVVGAQVPFLFTEFWQTEAITLLFLLGLVVALIHLRTRRSRLKLSRFLIIILLLTFYFTHDLQKHTSEKLASQKEIELAKLSSEHDAVAEMLFADLSDQLRIDSLLIGRLSYQIIDIDRVFDYLQRVPIFQDIGPNMICILPFADLQTGYLLKLRLVNGILAMNILKP